MTIGNTLLDHPPAIKVGEFVFRETAFGIVKRLRFVLDAIESERQRLGFQRSEFRVIDVGCGTGTYITIPLAQVGYCVFGVDTDHGSIKRARDNAAAVGLPSPEFICGRIEDLESASFHAAVCSEVLEHVAEPEFLLSGIRKLLKPSGLLLVTVPNGYGYFEVEEVLSRIWPKCAHYTDLLERRLIRVFGSSATKKRHYLEYGGLDPIRDRKRNELEQSSLAVDQKHCQKFTPKRIREHIRNQGFEIISFRNNTLLAGNILNALFRSADGFMSLNGRLADHLPSLMVADWLISAHKVQSPDFTREEAMEINSFSTSTGHGRDKNIDAWFKALRCKWSEVPAGSSTRLNTNDLLTLSEEELRRIHETATQESTQGNGFTIRGWYHCLYKDILRGKRVLDLGSGFGIDGIAFARAGATVTFVDVVEANVEVVRRLCRILNVVDADFCYMDRLESLSKLPNDFDVIWCQGSLLNAPFEIIRVEAQELLKHLKSDGRWIELGYPKVRWEREGQMPFSQWGDKTDGGAPWIEWYDLAKVLAILAPAQFAVVLYFNFHNDDFNWFDLKRVG